MEKRTAQSALFDLDVLRTLLLCAAGCRVATGTLLGFFLSDEHSKLSQRTLTFEERVAYQQVIDLHLHLDRALLRRIARSFNFS